jgi:hypothetical protein
MRRSREQKIDAYRDGALSPRRHAALARELAADAEGQAHLRQSEAVGRAVREVWSEGPPAPRVDLLIQSLRPAMARVDAEIAERPSAARSAARWLGQVRDLLGPVPLALAGAAAVLALALASPDALRGSDGAGVATAGIGSQSFGMGSPSAIYDLAQDAPLMIFEGEDGSTVIWILDAPEDQSLAPLSLSAW